MQDIYLNSFSIGAIIPFIFTLSVGLFLLKLPEKTTASLYLGRAFFTLAVFNFGYVIAACYYNETAAYHRWITVAAIFPLLLYFTQFFFHYSILRHKKSAKIFLYAQWLIAALATGVFIYFTGISEKIFHPHAQHWDFNADKISSIIAVIIMVYILAAIVAAVLKMKILKGKERWAVFGMLIAFLISSILPSLFNTLSREGLIDRGAYQVLYDILTISGLSVMVVIYLNHTKDKTTVMAKIVGISLLLFLLSFQALSFSLLNDKDRAYDEIKNHFTASAYKTDKYSKDLSYITVLSLNDRTFTNIYQKNGWSINYQMLSADFLNAFLWQKFESFSDHNLKEQVLETVKNNHKSFAGYKKLIDSYFEYSIDEYSKEDLLNYLSGFENLIVYHASKIKKTKEPALESALYKSSSFTDEAFMPFLEGVRIEYKNNNALNKQELLKYFSLFSKPSERRFRENKNNKEHYLSYLYVDLDDEKIYETGFSYRSYREYMHPQSVKILVIFIVIIVFIFGTPFFLKNSLATPLNNLLAGVEKVNKGDLDTVIPVRIKDQVGYISESFNNMVKSVKKANAKLVEHAENLEVLVEERTKDLNQSLEETRNLKNQQDGDYFLTSLLINPLGANSVKSSSIHIEFLVKQNKKFKFRKWRKEIGGDICIAHSISLKNKEFTVFLNADAMGKSMQGAGGVLVLGAVFQSIIERTRFSDDMKNQHPESWLKNAFVELHRIFESFKGSMLISLIIGIIEDNTGLLHFLNAEHPYPVLYRNQKAEFLEEETIFRKLGTLGIKGIVHTPVFQLMPKDILFVGSDGRDDLEMGLDEDGRRIINKDETLFLEIIQNSEGSMRKLYKNLLKTGKLTDDLSVMRISYKEKQKDTREIVFFSDGNEKLKEGKIELKKKNYENAISLFKRGLKLNSSNTELLKNLTKAYILQKEYKKAAFIIEDYITLCPADTEQLYVASHCNKKSGNLSRALELGEKVYLRNPHMHKNLVNMSSIYLALNKKQKASEFADEALKIDATNETAKKIKNRLG
ncbi:MAG: SpoIIE family protein phosphatase [Spirochaetia bacterium]|nr:SpoIIE family protein phosphatase [Spirochaetia bacterium]